MASAISKRQQARNERALQDLIRAVPGNDRCADCAAKNPGWASWNLGVFLCMRCAGLHRKLGTHVSKVKSLSMDSWTGDQVENMKKTGNVESNRRFNPRNTKADIPIDVDEVEGAMERYIRQKYEQRAFVPGQALSTAPTRQNTGSTGTGSWSEEPPPLPPKPGRKFGFSLRSASSTLPRPSKQERHFTPPLSPAFSGSDPEPTSPRERKLSNKPSQLFGMRITSSINNNFDSKLATLREMGFNDGRQNSDVLKSVNGNLDRAVEALVRLEGDKPASRPEIPVPRTLTPVSMASQGMNGISVDKTRQTEPKDRDPWEIRDSSPQRAATQPLPPRSHSAAPPQNSWNPFLSQPQQSQQQQPQALENSFQNLQLSQTGPSTQPQYAQPPQQQAYYQQAAYQNNPFQPASNPWDSMNMSQQQPPQPGYLPQQPQQQYQQPVQTSQASQQSSNPFLRKAQSQTFAPSSIWDHPAPQPSQPLSLQQSGHAFGNGNPWGLPQQQQQQQQSFFQQPVTESPAPTYGQLQGYPSEAQQPSLPRQQQQQQQQWPPQDQTSFAPASNPWSQQQPTQPLLQQMTGLPQAQQQPQSQPQPQQQLQQQQQYQPAPPPDQQPWTYTPKDAVPAPHHQARFDKASILAMYSQNHQTNANPSMAPPPPPLQQRAPLQAVQEDGSGTAQFQYPTSQPQQASYPYAQQQRSVTMPTQFPPSQQQPQSQGQGGPGQVQQMGYQYSQAPRHVSHESAAFMGFNGNGEGRQSPDAFAGLSARFVR
ncbi:hypothetical protein B0A50_04840 [Salinomyces thailandicus]|uniref:ArfGap-domain-containing protein n=1 Tax=Salinomyces thailandicus TaxID=706561 RepID=A0A4V5N4H3_9PEZI|nr:hypothetical protein B0A50_04840 [Salinomyces thailandica]